MKIWYIVDRFFFYTFKTELREGTGEKHDDHQRILTESAEKIPTASVLVVERKARNREKREDEEQRLFELKQQKKKEKHKGH